MGILGPQLSLEATIYHCHVHLAIPRLSESLVSRRSKYMNQMFIKPFPFFLRPQWAPGAIVYQRHVHLAILRVPGPQWATGATIWTTCLSSYFWAFCGPSEPQEPLYEPHAKLHLYGYSGSPVSSGSHCISPSCTSSHSQAVGVPNEP